jgi:carbon-monoxide dehydrogenase large subunit
VHGDTDKTPIGMGTYGSRSMAVGGIAMVRRDREDHRQGQEDRRPPDGGLEADIEFKDGTFTVGHRQVDGLGDVALAAYVPHNFPLEDIEPGLEERRSTTRPTSPSRPAATSARWSRPDTGKVEVVDFAAVDDFGNIINPMIVEGQVHGGIAQGVGQALTEGVIYDNESGQLLTGSYMDYCMPRPLQHRQH